MFRATPNNGAALLAALSEGMNPRSGAPSPLVFERTTSARALRCLVFAVLAGLMVIALLPARSAQAQTYAATYLPNVSASELAGASGTYFPGDTLVFDNEGAWELVYDGVDERGLWLRLVERTSSHAHSSGYFGASSRTQGGYFPSQQARATSAQTRTSYLRIPHGAQGGYWRVQSDDGRRQLGMFYERGALIVTSP